MPPTWCVNCWLERQQRTEATKEFDGDPLCESCYAQANGPGLPVKEISKKEGSAMATICGREGCGRELRAHNKTGYCSKHSYDAKRKTEPVVRVKRKKRPRCLCVPGCSVNGQCPEHGDKVIGKPETVTVPVVLLDFIWLGLTPQQKAAALASVKDLEKCIIR